MMSKLEINKIDPNTFKPITINIKIVIESQEEIDEMKTELKEGMYASNFSDFSSVFGDLIERISKVI